MTNIFKYKKQGIGQDNKTNDKLSSNTEDNSSINVTTPTKPMRISSGTYPLTPNSSKSSSNGSLQFVSGDITPNSISDGTLSDVNNNKREREHSIRNSSSFTRRSIKPNPIKKADEQITPASFPTCSRQEDEKNGRLREFREQYSLQQPNNNNINKRKRDENHYNVIFASYTVLKDLLTFFINILQVEIHPTDRHMLSVEPEYMDKLMQIMLCKLIK
jgi:hypothetical protein